MRVYLVSRYARFREMQTYRNDLHGCGHTVTSRWINGTHEGRDLEMDVAFRAQLAEEDVADLKGAAAVVAFTEPSNNTHGRGGRHVELGMALAYNKLVVIVGHRENVFCCLPHVIFYETWPEALESFRKASNAQTPQGQTHAFRAAASIAG